jgi:hypothetical protein
MAALNQQETENLRDVMKIVDAVLREGFDPNEPLDSLKRQSIVSAKNKLHNVIQKKGYYPS